MSDWRFCKLCNDHHPRDRFSEFKGGKVKKSCDASLRDDRVYKVVMRSGE